MHTHIHKDFIYIYICFYVCMCVFVSMCVCTFNAVYNQNPIDRWMKGCILPFSEKGALGLAKNYRGKTLTSIAVKIYNTLQRNRIESKTEYILRKNQNSIRRNRSTTSQSLTIRRILEGLLAKNLQATISFFDFTKAFDSIPRGKME